MMTDKELERCFAQSRAARREVVRRLEAFSRGINGTDTGWQPPDETLEWMNEVLQRMRVCIDRFGGKNTNCRVQEELLRADPGALGKRSDPFFDFSDFLSSACRNKRMTKQFRAEVERLYTARPGRGQEPA